MTLHTQQRSDDDLDFQVKTNIPMFPHWRYCLMEIIHQKVNRTEFDPNTWMGEKEILLDKNTLRYLENEYAG